MVTPKQGPLNPEPQALLQRGLLEDSKTDPEAVCQTKRAIIPKNTMGGVRVLGLGGPMGEYKRAGYGGILGANNKNRVELVIRTIQVVIMITP